MKPLYIFIHIPRTGGTTLSGSLYLHSPLKWDIEFVHMGPWGNEYRKRHAIPPIHQWPQDQKNQIQVVTGHDTFYGLHNDLRRESVRYFTFLRNPAKRLESAYNFYLCGFDSENASYSEPYLDFWTWYNRTQQDNSISKWLKERARIDNPKEVLSSFWHVGITEDLGSSMQMIYNELGIKNKWKSYRTSDGEHNQVEMHDLSHPDWQRDLKRRFKMNDVTVKKLEKRNQADFNLYNYFYAFHKSKKGKK